MARPLSPNQRGRIAEKAMEWGNLVFTGLVISQMVSAHPLNVWVGIFGLVLLVEAYWLAYWFMKRGGEE